MSASESEASANVPFMAARSSPEASFRVSTAISAALSPDFIPPSPSATAARILPPEYSAGVIRMRSWFEVRFPCRERDAAYNISRPSGSSHGQDRDVVGLRMALGIPFEFAGQLFNHGFSAQRPRVANNLEDACFLEHLSGWILRFRESIGITDDEI